MQTKRRWASVALLAAGIAIGVVMVATPAGAHVGGSVNHLWNHLKPKADNRYVNNNELLWAVVDGGTGTLARDNRAVSSQRFSAGVYEVIFNRNVTTCAYVATLADTADGGAPAGEIGLASRAGIANGVFVVTRDSAGAAADRDFHLTVTCNEAAAPVGPRVVPSTSSQPSG